MVQAQSYSLTREERAVIDQLRRLARRSSETTGWGELVVTVQEGVPVISKETVIHKNNAGGEKTMRS